MNQGWECPKCGKVYAPSVQQCFTCGKDTYYRPIYPVYPYYPITWGSGTFTVKEGVTYYTTNYVIKPDDPDSGVGVKP